MERKRQKKTVISGLSYLPVEQLQPGSLQPRLNFDDQKIMELAQSMTVHGVLQPLLVRKNNDSSFEIIAGERRFRAAKIARLKKIPCMVMDLIDEHALAIALVENVQREDLNPIEEALAYVRLRDTLKLNQDQVAERVGKDRSSIANILRLLRLPKPVQDMVIHEELSMGHARALLSLDSNDMMIMVAKKTLREGLSVRRIEGIIRSIKSGTSFFDLKRESEQSREQKSPIEREIKQKIEYELGTKVDLKKENEGYAVTIHFQSSVQLNLLLEKLGVEI